MQFIIANINTIYADFPSGNFIKTRQKVHKRTFTAAWIADKSNPHARFNTETDIFKHRDSRGIFKIDIFIINGLFDRRKFFGSGFVTDCRFNFQNFGHTLNRQERNLYGLEVFAKAFYRIIKHDQSRDKWHKVTAGDIPVDNQVAAVANDATDTDWNDNMHHRRHPADFLYHFYGDFENLGQDRVKAAKLMFLHIIGGNCLIAGIGFIVISKNFGVFRNAF